jgi:hypothetical protein
MQQYSGVASVIQLNETTFAALYGGSDGGFDAVVTDDISLQQWSDFGSGRCAFYLSYRILSIAVISDAQLPNGYTAVSGVSGWVDSLGVLNAVVSCCSGSSCTGGSGQPALLFYNGTDLGNLQFQNVLYSDASINGSIVAASMFVSLREASGLSCPQFSGIWVSRIAF